MTTKKKLQALHGLGREIDVHGTEEDPEGEYSGCVDSWEGLHLKAEFQTKEKRAAVDFKARGKRATLVAGVSFIIVLAFLYVLFPVIGNICDRLLELMDVAHDVLDGIR